MKNTDYTRLDKEMKKSVHAQIKLVKQIKLGTIHIFSNLVLQVLIDSIFWRIIRHSLPFLEIYFKKEIRWVFKDMDVCICAYIKTTFVLN